MSAGWPASSSPMFSAVMKAERASMTPRQARPGVLDEPDVRRPGIEDQAAPTVVLQQEPGVRFAVVAHAELDEVPARDRDPGEEPLDDPVLAELRIRLELRLAKRARPPGIPRPERRQREPGLARVLPEDAQAVPDRSLVRQDGLEPRVEGSEEEGARPAERPEEQRSHANPMLEIRERTRLALAWPAAHRTRRPVGGCPGDLWYHPPSRPALDPRRAPVDPNHTLEVRPLAKTPRTWTGARTPSGLKRVRQAQSRHDILQPRRTAAKTFVAKALSASTQPAGSTIDPVAALAEALSALDRAAKVGAIHPNAAARRKSRLTRKVNAALGGEHVQAGGRVVKTTGKAAAAKAAKARIAAGKAGKAKGAQTAAGKARAALSKTARAEAAAAKAAAEASATTAAVAPAAKATTTKATATKATATKATATKATATKAAPKKAATAPRRRPRPHRRRPPRRRPRRRRPRPRNSAGASPHRRRPGPTGAFSIPPTGRLEPGGGRPRTLAAHGRAVTGRRTWSGPDVDGIGASRDRLPLRRGGP